MMGMNQLPMTFEQITFIMNQNPMIKMMVYTLIQNPMVMNQMMNIINVLNYNPLILNQIKNLMNQEMMMMNNQMLNKMMNAMKNGGMMNQGMMMNNFEDTQQEINPTIHICFRNNYNKPIMIEGKGTDKISTIIEKYRKEANDYDDSTKFVFNAHTLNPSITLMEAGMTNKANVFVVVTSGVKGG